MIDYVAYSDMLSHQVDLCFPFEYGFYTDILRSNEQIVVDMGCGNASYLKKLANNFQANYYGYDISPELLSLVDVDVDDLKVENIELGSINKIVDNIDVLLLRLIMHQISDRSKFIRDLSSKLKITGKIIIIDPVDDKFKMIPELPLLQNKLRLLRSRLSLDDNGRKVNKFIEDEMNELGYVLDKHEEYYIPSLLIDYKEKYYQYMVSTSKIMGITDEELKEINDWYKNPSSYVQIGLFMYLFTRN